MLRPAYRITGDDGVPRGFQPISTAPAAGSGSAPAARNGSAREPIAHDSGVNALFRAAGARGATAASLIRHLVSGTLVPVFGPERSYRRRAGVDQMSRLELRFCFDSLRGGVPYLRPQLRAHGTGKSYELTESDRSTRSSSDDAIALLHAESDTLLYRIGELSWLHLFDALEEISAPCGPAAAERLTARIEQLQVDGISVISPPRRVQYARAEPAPLLRLRYDGALYCGVFFRYGECEVSWTDRADPLVSEVRDEAGERRILIQRRDPQAEQVWRAALRRMCADESYAFDLAFGSGRPAVLSGTQASFLLHYGQALLHAGVGLMVAGRPVQSSGGALSYGVSGSGADWLDVEVQVSTGESTERAVLERIGGSGGVMTTPGRYIVLTPEHLEQVQALAGCGLAATGRARLEPHHVGVYDVIRNHLSAPDTPADHRASSGQVTASGHVASSGHLGERLHALTDELRAIRHAPHAPPSGAVPEASEPAAASVSTGGTRAPAGTTGSAAATGGASPSSSTTAPDAATATDATGASAAVELPFGGELRGYQMAGLAWLETLHRGGLGGCLADDMGLGKTVQTLSLLSSLHARGELTRALCVVPISTLGNWEREIARFTPHLRARRHIGAHRTTETAEMGDAEIVLVSYATLRIDIELFAELSFDYLVLDEAQTIKNPNSKIFHAVTRLDAGSRLALTGTPVENNTVELWSVFEFLNPGMMGSLRAFKRDYGIPIERDADEARLSHLQTLIRPFLLRRRKQDVAPELPAREETILWCDMAPEQRRLYQAVRDGYRERVRRSIEEHGVAGSSTTVFEGLLRLRQVAILPALADTEYEHVVSEKYELLLEQLEQVVGSGNKAIVFSQFTGLLKRLAAYIGGRGIRFTYLDGSTRHRQREIDCFQKDDAVPLFLISLKAGGVGLNLTAADYVFLVDPWWNPAVEAQAIDRAHRIGRSKPVIATRFISTGTVEEKIREMQQRKQALAEQLMGRSIGALSQAEVLSLFE
jgi:superfamily II DNA or RNA helicase